MAMGTTYGEKFLEWVDAHRDEIKNAEGFYLHGPDGGMQQLGDITFAECDYSSEIWGSEYDEDDNEIMRGCEYGECKKGDVLFDTY